MLRIRAGEEVGLGSALAFNRIILLRLKVSRLAQLRTADNAQPERAEHDKATDQGFMMLGLRHRRR
jgi:hypothetical protein